MSRRAAKENSWLFNSNLPLSMVQELEKLEQQSKERLLPNNVPILPFDEDKIVHHMRNRIAGLGKEIIAKGVDGLKTAAKNGQLLPGYLIFEEVPLGASQCRCMDHWDGYTTHFVLPFVNIIVVNREASYTSMLSFMRGNMVANIMSLRTGEKKAPTCIRDRNSEHQ